MPDDGNRYCAACAGHGTRIHDSECKKARHRSGQGGYCDACFDLWPCEGHLRPIVHRILEAAGVR